MNKVAKIDETGTAVATVTPMDLLQIATQQGADIDKLEKLMALQERWEANAARKSYVISMAKFRENCPTIGKDAEAHNNKYATLSATLEQIQGLLSECGLSHSWKTEQHADGLTVTCCVTHIDGHQECTSMTAGPDTSGSKNAIQAIGSTQTYLSRYTLYSVLGLSSRDMDKDGDLPKGKVSDEQAAELLALADKAGTNAKGASYAEAVCNMFKVAAIPDLLAADFDAAKGKLEGKIK